MIIDLHIHSRDGSDGRMSLEEIFAEASNRSIALISITDHDSIQGQKKARSLAEHYGIDYITGVELNVTFAHPDYNNGKSVSLDFLGYAFDIHNQALNEKLKSIREYREVRAAKILENVNSELAKKNLPLFTHKDLEAIQDSVDGSFGRPHIANYMIKKGLVENKQEAFDRYLVKCNVPKMPLSLAEASNLIRQAGGKLFLAHPNNPNGTSLVSITSSLAGQQQCIADTMLDYIDGIECWHTSHDRKTTEAYLAFAHEKGLLVSGGSDCHQQPLIMGSADIPICVARQFGYLTEIL